MSSTKAETVKETGSRFLNPGLSFSMQTVHMCFRVPSSHRPTDTFVGLSGACAKWAHIPLVKIYGLRTGTGHCAGLQGGRLCVSRLGTCKNPCISNIICSPCRFPPTLQTAVKTRRVEITVLVFLLQSGGKQNTISKIVRISIRVMAIHKTYEEGSEKWEGERCWENRNHGNVFHRSFTPEQQRQRMRPPIASLVVFVTTTSRYTHSELPADIFYHTRRDSRWCQVCFPLWIFSSDSL